MPCKVGNGVGMSLLSEERGKQEAEDENEMPPCSQGMARPGPLSPVLVIKVMTVLLMPSLSRE